MGGCSCCRLTYCSRSDLCPRSWLVTQPIHPAPTPSPDPFTANFSLAFSFAAASLILFFETPPTLLDTRHYHLLQPPISNLHRALEEFSFMLIQPLLVSNWLLFYLLPLSIRYKYSYKLILHSHHSHIYHKLRVALPQIWDVCVSQSRYNDCDEYLTWNEGDRQVEMLQCSCLFLALHCR